MSANVRDIVLDLLLRIEQSKSFSHVLIDQEIRKGSIAPKDESLLTEIIYGTLQNKLYLDYVLEQFVTTNKKQKPWVQMLLRISVYQMYYLDRVPDHAIIHEAVEIAKKRGHKGIGSFVNGILRTIQRSERPTVDQIKDKVERISIETSHPLWLMKRWFAFYGEEVATEMAQANLLRQPMSIRIQPLRITREEAIEALLKEDIIAHKSLFSQQGLIIEQGNILRSDFFEKGFCTIQDESSMLVGELLEVEPGMTVLDACSAPGGKTTHIAEKMEDSGIVYALDLHKKKLRAIEEKQAELKLSIIQTEAHDARHLHERFEDNTFDRIVIDAPCSGFGVLRGKPDIRYHKTEADILSLAQIQKDILVEVAPLLKQNGKLIYSTCTVDREENDEIVATFLKSHPNFKVDPTFFTDLPEELQDSIGQTEFGLQLFPQTYQTDGFFLVRFVKNNE